VLNNVAHEHNESIADPLGNAWYDGNGKEIADKCHLMFGSPRGSTGSGQYNQVINGHGYWLQQIWSNRAGACVQRNSYPQPNATFTHKPSIPKHGQKVTFTSKVKEPGETKFTYRWTFPDGGTSTVKNPVHTFAGLYFAAPVTLIVTDSKGSQTRTINPLTVK
jgi:PKD repeat protein